MGGEPAPCSPLLIVPSGWQQAQASLLGMSHLSFESRSSSGRQSPRIRERRPAVSHQRGPRSYKLLPHLVLLDLVLVLLLSFSCTVAGFSAGPGLSLEFLFILHRHGSRSSSSYASSTPLYGNVNPGQLLPLGAQQLRLSGKEVRQHYLSAKRVYTPGSTQGLSPRTAEPRHSRQTAAGLSDGNVNPDTEETFNGKPRRTESRPEHIRGLRSLSGCVIGSDGETCSAVVALKLLQLLIPPAAIIVRASAYPRAVWSALAFLEGFYGLPVGCLVSDADLTREDGKHRVDPVCPGRVICCPSKFPSSPIGRADRAYTRNPSAFALSAGAQFCPRLEVTPAPERTAGSEKDPETGRTAWEACVVVRLPCVTLAPASADGLLKGVAAAEAPPDVWRMYSDVKTKPAWQAKEAEVHEWLRAASEVFGGSNIGDMGWRVGEMLVLEEEAGERCPLRELYKHLTGEQHCNTPSKKHSGLAPDLLRGLPTSTGHGALPVGELVVRRSMPPSVTAGQTATAINVNDYAVEYLRTLDGIREAYRAGFDLLYGDEALSRYIAEGCLRLLNALLRCKAYRRLEDREDLRAVAAAVGGLHGLEVHEDLADRAGRHVPGGYSKDGEPETVQLENLAVVLLSLHDHSIIGFLSTLGVYDHQRVPAAAKVYVELVSNGEVEVAGDPEATKGLQVVNTNTAQTTGVTDKSALAHGSSVSPRGQEASGRPLLPSGDGYQSSRQRHEVHRRLSSASEPSDAHTSWPGSSNFVRISYGTPGQPMAVLRIPFCVQHFQARRLSEETLCPLGVWLDHTYQLLEP